MRGAETGAGGLHVSWIDHPARKVEGEDMLRGAILRRSEGSLLEVLVVGVGVPALAAGFLFGFRVGEAAGDGEGAVPGVGRELAGVGVEADAEAEDADLGADGGNLREDGGSDFGRGWRRGGG